ncbi:hypothetical protein [Marixanthomonas spongiae]|uniref:DUF4412 domain-containing protein n=1 Tax=Marixanthomonas spongiae TaxID=2174845 RepID=A0A2U0I3W8_9FLAO|nr:hypothetical protein [Marixanthomonas spongiae]PVW15806.1 hypothetical protein DDV96_05940 [Marixanthomonas spongiae]
MKLGAFFCILIFCASTTIKAQSFTGSFDLIISLHYKNENQRSDTLSYTFGKTKTALVIHTKRNQPDLRLVFNSKDSTITGLFDHKGKKGGYILPMNSTYWPAMDVAMRDYGTGPRTTLNYTGKTKEIEGHQTREVLAENEAYSASLWLPEAIELHMGSVLAYQSVGAGKDTEAVELFDQFGVEGLPLLMHLTSKTGRADVVLRVENLSETVDPAIFSSEGHSLSRVEQP